MESVQAHPCIEQIPLGSPEACKALCYPRPKPNCCLERLSLLEAMGAEAICSAGGRYRELLGFGVLGVGRSSVVLLASFRRRLLAVKSRRVDGKRESLVSEGRLLTILGRSGVAPRPEYYSRDLIVMDYVEGPTLEDIIVRGEGLPRRLIAKAVREALRASIMLDSLGILHLELSRPWRNIVFTESLRALIIDLESSSRGCGNLAKLVGGLARVLGEVRSLLGEEGFRILLSRYKRSGCDESFSYEVEKRVVEAVLHGAR